MDNKQIKILLVEDEPIAQIIGQNIIEKAGYNVDIVSSRNQAIEMLMAKKYDLIFMDLGLPGASGIDITKELMNAKLETPIIAVTAFNTNSKRDECIKIGFKEFIEKPFTEEQLAKIIQDCYEFSNNRMNVAKVS